MLRAFSIIAAAAAALPVAAAPIYFPHERLGVGDPNPYFEYGTYSVFYLQNKGRHPWYVTRTNDLLTWSPPVEAIPVGEPEDADHWTGSGSVVSDPEGGYRLFHTGHRPEAQPKEVTMTAIAPELTGPWTKAPGAAFSGAPIYDTMDFRDPFVFWNADAERWWMLLTTRHFGAAAIGLYTSRDLAHWSPAQPLYTEQSPLNLEVPDLFPEGGDWFLLYSDQRASVRQVRYLHAADSQGPYEYGLHDALDGSAYYAGKSAGQGDDRLLFGRIAHKSHRKDAMDFVWGGDLIVHALRRTADGELAVALPAQIASQFDTAVASPSPSDLSLGDARHAVRAWAEVAPAEGGAFGIRFQHEGAARSSSIIIDPSTGRAAFRYNEDGTDGPSVSFPIDPDGRFTIDIVVDPEAGLGILYINDFRALSFRYYRVGRTQMSLFAESGFKEVSGVVSKRRSDLAREGQNG
ncbi:MAG TPA: hypothetical protein VIL88_17990 [Devosia sp.]|jgi:hypothetical protein|uniref:hypothetical protein n=1 Tax=Devosia sp. TaxID=1871048 RepID=UPI002F92B850